MDQIKETYKMGTVGVPQGAGLVNTDLINFNTASVLLLKGGLTAISLA